MGITLIIVLVAVLVVAVAWAACRATELRIRNICSACKKVCVDTPDCEVGKEIRERQSI